MKILAFACVHGREKIVRVFAAGIERLQRSFDIEPMVVVSDEMDYDLCTELGLHPVMHPNTPLGKKHNLGLQSAFKRDFSHLCLLGSDDLISNEGLELLIKADKIHAGFRKMIAYDTRSGNQLVHEYPKDTRIIGAGRLIHRQALEDTFTRTNFFHRIKGHRAAVFSKESRETSMRAAKHLQQRGQGMIKGIITGAWDDELNRNLDNSLDANLSLCGFPPFAIESEKIHIVDLKTSENLNGMCGFHLQEGKVTPYTGDWDWFLSPEEKSMIESMKVKNP